VHQELLKAQKLPPKLVDKRIWDERLAELNEMLRQAGTRLCFAELKDPVKDKLKRFGLFTKLANSPLSQPFTPPWTGMSKRITPTHSPAPHGE
jgi:hypothetical protein